jgi:L-ascorbate metabolism protein UlaG (beta-lactamase superfamily)
MAMATTLAIPSKIAAATTGAPVIANYDLCMWLAGKRLAKFDPMNTGGATDQAGFTVTLVRADHSSGDIAHGMPIYLGNPCGVIIKAAGEATVYHMGDTDIFSDLGLIAEATYFAAAVWNWDRHFAA